MKTVLWCLGIVLILFLLFLEELYRYVFCRKSSALFTRLFDSKGHEDRYYQVRDAAKARLQELPCQRFTIRSDRGEQLRGFYYSFGAGGKKIAFIIHGYRSEHAETAGMFADYYRSRGIDVFCCDHTASGESEGKFIGFDLFETEDCLKWISFLTDRFGDDIQILLHGFSMGAATVMKMSGRCPEQVKCIVEDSGYESAKASLRHMVGPLYGPLRLVNRAVAGYDLNASDVKESLSEASLTILFIHGQDDRLVPYFNGPKLFDFYSGEKDCFFPEKTRHIESMYTSPEAYSRKLDALIARSFR